MHELFVALLVRGVVIAGSCGVFDGAVVGHGKRSPSRSKDGRTGVTAIVGQGQRRRLAFGGRLQADLGERRVLPPSHLLDRKALDRLIEQAIEIEFSRQVQKNSAKS